MSPYDLANYETVEERLARFWADHKDRADIVTELVHSENGDVMFKATIQIYHSKPGSPQTVTGWAQETKGSGPVNKTSWVENCETSAIGRALANLGYAPKGARPSREEMSKQAPPSEEKPERSAPPQPSGKAADGQAETGTSARKSSGATGERDTSGQQAGVPSPPPSVEAFFKALEAKFPTLGPNARKNFVNGLLPDVYKVKELNPESLSIVFAEDEQTVKKLEEAVA